MRNDEIEAMRLVDGSNKAAIQVAGSGRNYGIDCLKSISMLMVVILHVLGFGGWLSEYPATSVMGVVIWLPETFSYCAVDCFAIVTGYVYSSSRFRYSNLAGLWLRALYYSFGITLLWVLLGDRGGGWTQGLGQEPLAGGV